jgi:hypothetical protein
MSRRRSRYEDEDDDDRPRRRGRDDDDLPRTRGRWREDEAASSAKRTGRKRISPVLILGIVAGVFALLLAVGIGIYFVARSAAKPASVELLAHVPADATTVAGYDLEELADSEAYRKALERQPLSDVIEIERSGLRQADLSRFVVAHLSNNGYACVIRFRAAPDRSKYLGPDLSGKTYAPFTSLTSVYKFGYFADANTLVLADKEPTIQAVRDKGGKARLASELKDMTDRARGPIWRATGRGAAVNLGIAQRAGAAGGTCVWVEPVGLFADVKMELRFDSSDQARIGAATVRGLLVQQRGLATEFGGFRTGNDPSDFETIRNGYDAAVVKESGTRVSVSLRLPATEALRLLGSGPN